MQKIEVDWDIHKLIELERRGFDEAPYIALRRLLNLPPPNISRDEVAPSDLRAPEAGIPWSEDGVVVPHGSLARMEYLRGTQIYEGQFSNGRLLVGGQSFDTLSAAASALARTKDGKRTSLNGWSYWQVRFPGESRWRALGEMRQQS